MRSRSLAIKRYLLNAHTEYGNEERSGSVVDRVVVCSCLTRDTVLCPNVLDQGTLSLAQRDHHRACFDGFLIVAVSFIAEFFFRFCWGIF